MSEADGKESLSSSIGALKQFLKLCEDGGGVWA